MSSSFWLLGVESHDFSHAEKKGTSCKAEQTHKMTTIFTKAFHKTRKTSKFSKNFFC